MHLTRIIQILQSMGFAMLSILIWPVLGGITLVNEVIRAGLSIILLFTRYRLLKHGTDSMIWSSQLSGKMVVVPLYSRDPIDLKKEVALFKAAFSKKEKNGSFIYAKLMKVLCIKFGYGCLMDQDDFKVENHVKIFKTGSRELSEAQFTREILPKLLENMDENKPQWEWLIFPKIRRSTGELNSVRVFRWDHSFFDGAYAGIFMTENIFDQNPEKPEFFINPRKSVGFLPAKLWAYLNLPLILVQGICEVLFRTGNTNEKRKIPFAVSNYGIRNRPTFAGPVNIDLNLVKPASRAVNCNILSLLVTSYGPTLYNFLPEHEKGQYESSINVSLMLAATPYQDIGPRNQFTSAIATAPFSKLAANQDITRIEPDWSIYFGQVYLDWLGRLPIPLLRAFLSVGEVTVSLNNIPFLRRKGTINGGLIEEVAGWAMLCVPLGVDILATSYGDKITLTVHSMDDCMTSEQLQAFLSEFKGNIYKLAQSYVDAKEQITIK